MAVFKCKMCGGTLEVNEGATVCECEYCGTTQTISKSDNEQTINMLNRATHFRQQCEFDKAMEIYEKLLDSVNNDSEIFWQIVLCRYGIEYVDDPTTGKKIPTCHRTQYSSIFNDADYLEAVRYADEQQKEIYTKEAQEIDSIQKGILEISEKEEPFDIFICYKESDNGKRTPDSVLAQDLYYQLEQEGFKVFFSKITLEGKLGTAYEPYIFAALNSAKVMVVVGTKAEYFNSVWVRNEWGRFLMLMQKDKTRTIIPAYKNMDPYDLPEELSFFQAQDMSKLGFMQDLIRGIKKLTNSEKKKESGFDESKSDSKTIKPLLKRAFMFLEDGEWSNADEYSEKVLDIDPECSEAYLIKLLVDLKLKSKSELLSQKKSFSSNIYYKRAVKYADAKFKKELEDYSNERTYREASDEYNNKNYNQASDIFKTIPGYKDSDEMAKECIYVNATNAYNKQNYTHASDIFKTIPGYKDSDEMAKECLYLFGKYRFEKKIYSDAERTFNKIPDYKDSKKLAEQCHEKVENASKDETLNEAAELMKYSGKADNIKALEKLNSIKGWKNADELIKECENRLNEIELRERKIQKKAKIKKKIIIVSVITGCVIITAGIIYYIATINARKYDDAMEQWEKGKYNDAYSIFADIPDYKDSAKAMKLLSVQGEQIKDYDEKVSVLEELEDYRNAKELLNNIKYDKLSELVNAKKYEEAVELFNSLEDQSDPSGYMKRIYKTAVNYENDRKFAQAAEIFIILDKYEDSAEHVEKIYEQACTYMKDKKYNYAAAVFMALGDYKDSKDNIDKLYEKSIKYIEDEKYTDAIPILKNLEDYKDSKNKLDEIHKKASELMKDKKYDAAAKIYKKLGNLYDDCEDNIAKIEDLKLQDKYDKAVKLADDGDYDEAIKLFEELG
ncbi:TIR domain-containing protein, partial [Porcipelethomonas sp.]|uniref:TIR domain-containing protein n=1 Tax=Porcipelethomonas sp. TaxID=2981675 RepID=UPI003EF4BF1F